MAKHLRCFLTLKDANIEVKIAQTNKDLETSFKVQFIKMN